MNKERFDTYLKQPETMNEESLNDLRQVVNDYPFFSAGRIMLLRNLNLTHDSDYEKELPLTAIYAGSRSILYNYIFNQTQKTKTEAENSVLSSEGDMNQAQGQPDDAPKEVAATKIPLNEPAPDPLSSDATPEIKSKSAVHSFENWVDIMSSESHEKEPLPPKKQKSWDLIDNFIQGTPKIPQAKEANPEKPVSANLADDSAQHHEEFMTETLAKIYIKQKHYNKAIQIFKKLSLKYPEKSIYFAGQIKIVEQLLNNEK